MISDNQLTPQADTSLQQPRTDLQQSTDSTSQSGQTVAPQTAPSLTQGQLQADGLRIGDTNTVVSNSTQSPAYTPTSPSNTGTPWGGIVILIAIVVVALGAIVRRKIRPNAASSTTELDDEDEEDSSPKKSDTPSKAASKKEAKSQAKVSKLERLNRTAAAAKRWWVWGCYVCLSSTMIVTAIRDIFFPPIVAIVLAIIFGLYAWYLFNGGSFVFYFKFFLLAPVLLIFAFVYDGPHYSSQSKTREITCAEFNAMNLTEKTKIARDVAWDQTSNTTSESLRELAARGFVANFCTYESGSTKLGKYIDDPSYYIKLQ